MYIKCSFPDCQENCNVVGRDLCDGCFIKVVRYECALDEWLQREHPDLFLDDVTSWYTKCTRQICKRDCLEPNDYCECCPHFLQMGYQRFKIENMLMPTREFLLALHENREY